jgi:hypothetical protein
LTPIPPQTPIVVAEREDIVATFSIVSIDCLDSITVNYSLVDLFVSGGKFPYTLIIINSLNEKLGPFTIPDSSQPLQLKIYGGDWFQATVQSYDGLKWVGKIAVPLEDTYCQKIVPATFTPTLTFTPTPTPTPTNTPPGVIEASTRAPNGNNNNQSTKTPYPPATNPPATNPPATNPPATNPPATDPPATNPPATDPPATNTPIIINPKECEDGVDNDGDQLIDLADPQCKKASDPTEDK